MRHQRGKSFFTLVAQRPQRKAKLAEKRQILISPKQLEFNSPVRIKDVLKYPFVMRNSDSGTNSFVQRYLKKNKIKKDQMNIVSYADSSQSLVQFVKEGIGLSVISEIALKEYVNRDSIHMYHIEDFNNERHFYLVYNIDRTLSVIAKKFIEEATNLVEKKTEYKKEEAVSKVV